VHPNLAVLFLILLSAACSPIEPVTDEFEPSYVERTDPFDFRIGVPSDLAEAGWQVDDPQRITSAPFSESFRRLHLDRVFSLGVDQPTGGLFLTNHLGELVTHVRSTELVIYVYARIPA
jgi:hypothetical protein